MDAVSAGTRKAAEGSRALQAGAILLSLVSCEGCAPRDPRFQPEIRGDSCASARVDGFEDGPTAEATDASGDPLFLSIAQIQGAAHRSRWVGRHVEVVGIVTATATAGFYMQSEVPDSDPATSEGLFVGAPEGPLVQPRDRVSVVGPVAETRPGCGDCGPGDAAFDSLSVTEIAAPNDVSVEASGARLPEPVAIGVAGRRPPAFRIDGDGAGDVEDASIGDFDVCADAIDFYESLEHMLVQVDEARAVGPTTAFGEIAVVGDAARFASELTPRGGIIVRPNDSNPERVLVDDALVRDAPSPAPRVNVGARFVEPIVGVMGYELGSFRLFNTAPLSVEGPNDLRREQLELGEPRVDELDLATFNVENLSVQDPEERLEALAAIVVGALESPDVLVLQEVQDDSGSADDGVVTSQQTLTALARSIQRVGGPHYSFADVAPLDGEDGGEPGGNIRVALLVTAERGAGMVLRGAATATTPNRVMAAGGSARLLFSPGRIDPMNAAFAGSRKPLASEIAFRGRTLVVIANHFNSKGSDEPMYGRWQPPTLVSEAKRQAQARVVADFVAELLAEDPELAVLVAGDFNDFEFSRPLRTLENAELTNGLLSLLESERYTYVFEGNSQALDHALLSSGAARRGFEYDIVHLNAEFHDGVTDHDPSVIRLRFE